MTITIHAAPIAFSVGEVAKLLGCSTDTVRRMIASGRLDAVQPLGKGGRVFVGRASIERLFDEAAADVRSDATATTSSGHLTSPSATSLPDEFGRQNHTSG